VSFCYINSIFGITHHIRGDPYLNSTTDIVLCVLSQSLCLYLGKNVVLWKISDIILESVAMRQPIRLVFRYCSDVLTHTCIKKSFTFIGCKLQVILK